jgi:hypothetical protein
MKPKLRSFLEFGSPDQELEGIRVAGPAFDQLRLPQPQQRVFSGYISNGSTGIARVTFLDGLTGAGRGTWSERDTA